MAVGFAVTKWGSFQSMLGNNDRGTLTLLCYRTPLEASLTPYLGLGFRFNPKPTLTPETQTRQPFAVWL